MTKFQRLLLGTTLTVGLALAGGSAFAADLMAPPAGEAVVSTSGGGYISVFGGYGLASAYNAHSTVAGTDFSAPLQAGYIIGVAVGAHVAPNVRLEGELSYSSRNLGTFPGASGSLSTLYLLANAWFDLDTGSAFTPYIGGGLGVADIMPNMAFGGNTFTTSAFAPAAQLGVGVKFNVADNMSIDLGYRVKDVFNASLTGSVANDSNVNYLDQSVQIGLDIGF